MDYKWIGAVLIITACGGFGFSLAAAHRREEHCLRNFMRALDYMSSELHFHAPALPELCRGVSRVSSGTLGRIFLSLCSQLEACAAPDVAACMESALEGAELPPQTLEQLRRLGSALGRFDLDGQLKGLEAARESCNRALELLMADREMRLRNYQTLSLCAGAALVIVLI